VLRRHFFYSLQTILHRGDIKAYFFPNPTDVFIAIQIGTLVKSNIQVQLMNTVGEMLETKTIFQGNTISYFDTQTLYDGIYFIKISDGLRDSVHKIIVNQD